MLPNLWVIESFTERILGSGIQELVADRNGKLNFADPFLAKPGARDPTDRGRGISLTAQRLIRAVRQPPRSSPVRLRQSDAQ